jgi:hypothetical protein
MGVENGDVIVDKGYSTVTVRDVHAESSDDAANKARPKADAFLNELCLQHEINLEIGNGWTVMLQDFSTTRHIKKYTIKTTLKGGHRKRIPRVLKEVKVRTSDAKNYYRKAAISQDTFDKFRNLYLVIENIASKIAAAKRKDKCGDSQLIELGLRECFSSNIQLLEDYGHIRELIGKGDTIKLVAAFLHKGNRCQLNHSKAIEDKKIPFNPEDESEVQSVLPLTKFIAKSLISYEDIHLAP